MSLTIPALYPEHEAILTLLRSISSSGGPLGVYDARGPDRPHEQVPYCVAYPYTPALDGPSGDPYADLDYQVLIRSVGGTRAQAQDAADRVRLAMLGTGPTPPAGRALRGIVSVEPLRGVTRDDDADLVTDLYLVDDLFTVPTTPA